MKVTNDKLELSSPLKYEQGVNPADAKDLTDKDYVDNQGGTGIAGIPMANRIYVNDNGFTGTPAKGNPFTPYQTYIAARNVATDDDVIVLIGMHDIDLPLNRNSTNAVTRVHAETPLDGLTVVEDFMSLIGSDTQSQCPTGTTVIMTGKGTYRMAAIGGPPAIYDNTDTVLYLRAHEFDFNEQSVLQGVDVDMEVDLWVANKADDVLEGGRSNPGRHRASIGHLRFDVDLGSGGQEIISWDSSTPGYLIDVYLGRVSSSVTQTGGSGAFVSNPKFFWSGSTTIPENRIIRGLYNEIDNFQLTQTGTDFKALLLGNIVSAGPDGGVVDGSIAVGTGIIKTSDGTVHVPPIPQPTEVAWSVMVGNRANVSSTIGYTYVYHENTTNQAANSTSSGAGIRNGDLFPLPPHKSRVITDITIVCAAAATSTSSVATGTVNCKLELYTIDFNSESAFPGNAFVNVPATAGTKANINTFNNLGGKNNANVVFVATGLNIAIPDDALWGIRFKNESGNAKINALSRYYVTVHGKEPIPA